MAAGARRGQRRVSRPALVFALLGLLVACFGAVLMNGSCFHLRLTTDRARLSPTMEGALAREGLEIGTLLDALPLDADLSLKTLRQPDGPITERLAAVRALTGTLKQFFSTGRIGAAFRAPDTTQIQALLDRADRLGAALSVLSWILPALLAAALLLLLLRRPAGAAALAGLCGLLAGALPLLSLLAVRQTLDRLRDSLSAIQRYGVGLGLQLRLTDAGKAEVLLCAAALLLSASALLLTARDAGRKRG